MKEWYELTNELETGVPPLSPEADGRIRSRVRTALPRRRHWRLAAAIAAVLVLSACGYAVATGQFSSWFWNVAADPRAPEGSEDLLSRMGTVIDQSQTADGVTVTLEGALWDGDYLMLTLTLSGEGTDIQYWSSVDTADSWLRGTDAQLEQSLRETNPNITDQEMQQYLDFYHTWSSSFLDISYVWNRRAETCYLQVRQEVSSKADSVEMQLHLENLTIKDTALQGPFDFIFTVDRKPLRADYTGDVVLQPEEGPALRVTGVTVTAFQVTVNLETLEAVPEDYAFPNVGPLRDSGGQEVGSASGHRWQLEHLEDGRIQGSSSQGPFRAVVDPAAVEAVCIGGTWLELSQLTPAES